jgi:ABC-type glycerol-3-phosphate transport system permease component
MRAIEVPTMKNARFDKRVQIALVYALLIAGAFVFCWPLAWMGFTSFKADRELFSRDLTLLPESPGGALASPFVDGLMFKLPSGKKRMEAVPLIRERVEALLPAQLDVDRAQAVDAVSTGAFKRLLDTLPRSEWLRNDAELKELIKGQVDQAMVDGLLFQVRRNLVLGQLRARSYDVQEDILVPVDQAATAWALGGDAKASLKPLKGLGAELHYDLGTGKSVVMQGTFKTSFDLKRLYRIQFGVKCDDSWHDLRVYVEKDGKRFEAVRAHPMADANWTLFTWQEPGPDDQTNKIRTWNLLQPAQDQSGVESRPRMLKVTLVLERAERSHAWLSKIKRNYLLVFDNMPFWRYVATSFFLVALNLVGTIFSCSLVAYAFARLNWPGRELSFGVMMATMMIPAQVTMIPFFLIIRYLDWYNTLYPLWVCSFFANAFNVFLMHQFFKGIPRDLEDAAKIDGCGPIRSYWYIMLPLVKPSLATVAVFTFMGVWNDFMGPLIYLSDQRLYPLSLGLFALNVQATNGSMAMMMAGSFLMILPVVLVFFFAQRYFIQGITMTGMKG